MAQIQPQQQISKTQIEQTYTSTEQKLLIGGLERLLLFQQTGTLRPQSLQLAPEDNCQMDCVWCSTKYRLHEYTQTVDNPAKVIIGEKKAKADYIPFDDIIKTVDALMAVGPLKTVELTGAGDPTLYRDRESGEDINELISYLHDDIGLEVGMITNGVGLTRLVKQEQLHKLSWLRVSLAVFDPQNFHGNNDGKSNERYVERMPDLPDHITGKMGFSYVWGPYSKLEVLAKIADYAKDHQVDFVRIVPDCLDAPRQAEYRDKILPIVADFNKDIGREVLFFQAKRYDVHSSCRIGFIKPFLNADGYFYHCSAVPLYNQGFTPHWRMGHMSEVDKIWSAENIMKGFDTSKCEYGKCFYAPQNEILDTIKKEGVHKNFI